MHVVGFVVVTVTVVVVGECRHTDASSDRIRGYHLLKIEFTRVLLACGRGIGQSKSLIAGVSCTFSAREGAEGRYRERHR